ncbi:MAG: hypothetical protein PSX81_03245 [bacterium]|nr:hypothetical protein [bacterium]
MKYIIFTLFYWLICPVKSQSCNCLKDSTLAYSMPSCDTIQFKNGSLIYWQFDCDFAWLTFETVQGTKEVIDNFDSNLGELIDKLGLEFEAEYKAGFLMERPTCSGSDCPMIYQWMNANTGKTEKYFENVIEVYKDSIHHFMINFKDEEWNSILVFDMDNCDTFEIVLPIKSISMTLNSEDDFYLHAWDLFAPAAVVNQQLCLTYQYNERFSTGLKQKNSVFLNLKN